MPVLPYFPQIFDAALQAVATVTLIGVGAFVILLAAMIVMGSDSGETPRCDDCGESLEEGRDMALEDDFDPPDRAA